MKYLRRFNESDNIADDYQTAWAGSSWAFNNPEIPIDPKTEPIPLKQAYPYKCLDCDCEYLFMKEDGDPICPLCGSNKYESDDFNI